MRYAIQFVWLQDKLNEEIVLKGIRRTSSYTTSLVTKLVSFSLVAVSCREVRVVLPSLLPATSARWRSDANDIPWWVATSVKAAGSVHRDRSTRGPGPVCSSSSSCQMALPRKPCVVPRRMGHTLPRAPFAIPAAACPNREVNKKERVGEGGRTSAAFFTKVPSVGPLCGARMST